MDSLCQTRQWRRLLVPAATFVLFLTISKPLFGMFGEGAPKTPSPAHGMENGSHGGKEGTPLSEAAAERVSTDGDDPIDQIPSSVTVRTVTPVRGTLEQGSLNSNSSMNPGPREESDNTEANDDAPSDFQRLEQRGATTPTLPIIDDSPDHHDLSSSYVRLPPSNDPSYNEIKKTVDPRRLSVSRLFSHSPISASSNALATTAVVAKGVLKAAKKLLGYRKTTPAAIPAVQQAPEEVPTAVTDRTTLLEAEEKVQEQRSQTARQIFQINNRFEKTQNELKQSCLAQKTTAVQERAAISGVRGIPFSLHLPTKKISEIQKQYHHDQLVAQTAKQLALYETEFQLLQSFLEKRNFIAAQHGVAITDSDSPNAVTAQALQDIQNKGSFLIKDITQSKDENFDPASLGNEQLSSLPNEQLTLIAHLIDFIRGTQFFILGSHTSYYIDKVEEAINEVQEDLIVQHKDLGPLENIYPGIEDHYIQTIELLEKTKAAFSLMETKSTVATMDIAERSADAITKVATEISSFQRALEEERLEARPERYSALDAAKKQTEMLHESTQSLALAYRELHDEAWIEKKSGSLHNLKETLELKRDSFLEKAKQLGINYTADPFKCFKDILKNDKFTLDNRANLPQTPSDFLKNILNIPIPRYLDQVIGTHGKVALDTPPSNQLENDKPRREWATGTNLMRGMICEHFGFHIMQTFDQFTLIKRTENNSLKFTELKKFLFGEGETLRYHAGFFIDPKTAHEDFLKMLALNHDGSEKTFLDNKVIKIDQATLDFNPFSKTNPAPSGESISAAELRQREAGFQYVRKALEKAFPEAFLSTEQLEKVLTKFDEKFKVCENGPLLTEEAAHSFIQNEKENLNARSYWEKNIARHLDQEKVSNLLSGAFYWLGNHLPSVAIAILYFLYYHTLTHLGG